MSKRPSQNDLILEVLADGQPHSYKEIHRHAGFCRLNSRIAELRTRGHNIPPCDKSGGDYRYQLLTGPLAEPDPTIPRPSTSGSGSGSPSGVGHVELDSGQLVLVAA
jgi:hypothetical protein